MGWKRAWPLYSTANARAVPIQALANSISSFGRLTRCRSAAVDWQGPRWGIGRPWLTLLRVDVLIIRSARSDQFPARRSALSALDAPPARPYGLRNVADTPGMSNYGYPHRRMRTCRRRRQAGSNTRVVSCASGMSLHHSFASCAIGNYRGRTTLSGETASSRAHSRRPSGARRTSKWLLADGGRTSAARSNSCRVTGDPLSSTVCSAAASGSRTPPARH